MSGRSYGGRGFDHPQVLRIDPRPKEPIIEELSEHIKKEIKVAVKKGYEQARYRQACMDGEEHPLRIEIENYTLVMIHVTSIDASVFMQHSDPHSKYKRFSEPEIDFINLIQQRPEIEWAIDNSFDGLYVQRYDDYARMATSFQFAVYMKEEQATFWKLKYSGT